jgi:DNA-binding MarR family transcriptional regulator
MLHVMRSINEVVPGPAGVGDSPTGDATASDDLADAIVTEVLGSVGDLRCASMGRLVQQHLSMTQMHVLWLLQHHGTMTMSRLAELLDVSLSNATGLMDRMEEHGLVERIRVPDDRRLVIVQPAEAGRRALSETEATRRDRMRAVVSRIDPAEQRGVLAAFLSFRRALGAELGEAEVHQHHFAENAD